MENHTEIDVIILSYAHTEALRQTTLNCISSLLASENPQQIRFNPVVIESEKTQRPQQYPGTVTIYPERPFGYHRYMNIGIAMTSSPYICLCNNDLVFHQGWATEILKPFEDFADVHSASPVCSIHHPAMGYKLNDGLKLGYRIREELAGWCLFFRRDLLKLTGKPDENYLFWCADNDYANTLWALNLNHVLVTSSVVDHLENTTLNQQSEERKIELTEKEGIYFDKKWNYRLGKNWELL